MTMIHVPTVYLFLSFLYILLPAAVWMTLNNQQSRSVVWWCAGGELLAMGLLLIGLRDSLPAWISYPVANVLCWLALLIQVMALQHVLTPKSWMTPTLTLVLVWLVGFEYFRLGLGNGYVRFIWSLTFFCGAFASIAYVAHRIDAVFGLKNARLLSVIYSAATAILCVRVARVMFGYTEPDAVAQGADSLLIVVSGVLVSVLGNFAFVGLFIERANKREMLAIAERVRQEESARLGEQIAQLERQRTLGAMSYSFAHELSQPLTAILMDTHAIQSDLQRSKVNVAQITESVADIERSANRTVHLIDRIRGFIRPTCGEYDNVDLKVLVHDVQHLLVHDIRQHNIQFQWDLDTEACTVWGDKIQLSQIVLNVYRNAIQAMSGQAVRKMSISLHREDQRVVLRVHDSGTGLDESIKDKVGQPFVTTKNDGLGVGLSISKTIAEMHSGSLSITNAVGGGVLVELNLPAAQA